MADKGLLSAVAAVFGTVLLLAGCGGPPSTDSAPATAGETSKSTVPMASGPLSLPALQKILLQQGDLPPGWTSKPHKAVPGEAAIQKAFRKCTGTPESDAYRVAETYSRDFTYARATVASTAASYRVQSAPDGDIAMLRSAKFSPCSERGIRKVLATVLPAGAKVESASIRTTPATSGTPSNVTATQSGTVKVGLNGQRVTIHTTTAYINGPLFAAAVSTLNIGEPLTPSLVRTLVASVAARAPGG